MAAMRVSRVRISAISSVSAVRRGEWNRTLRVRQPGRHLGQHGRRSQRQIEAEFPQQAPGGVDPVGASRHPGTRYGPDADLEDLVAPRS